VGGVGHYCSILAGALAARGDDVTIYAPPGSSDSAASGAAVKLLPDHFGPRSLLYLSRTLRSQHSTCPVLVQYVPHNFGWKLMNVLFCLWLWLWRHADKRIWIMFHEVSFPFVRGQSWRRHFLALVQHVMAFCCLRAASRIFVSCAAFKSYIEKTLACRKEISVLPVFSNIPDTVDDAAVKSLRHSILPQDEWQLIGHFGKFQKTVSRTPALPYKKLLERHLQLCFLLIGENAELEAGRAKRENPETASRILALSNASAAEAATALASCDLVIQPYQGGANSRHSSLLASLALGKPIVTNLGPLSEPFWASSSAVALASSSSEEDIYRSAEALLSSRDQRRELSAKAIGLYRDVFHLDRTLEVLYQKAEEDDIT